MRNHIKEVHIAEKSFECRHCSFRCSLLKEFFKHCRVHRDSQKCSNCGKKFALPKLFQDHIPNCKGKVNINFDDTENAGCEDKYKMKIVDDLDKGSIPYQNSLDLASTKKRWMKRKQDLEYKVESKHYSQQIKKMALEQPMPTRSRCRDRSHRCYLCFKLFSNRVDLDAHKEVYHQAKSSQPVRVKTDDSLGKDEDDAVEFAKSVNVHSHGVDVDEEVQIKSEPCDVAEKIENITIVLDEWMNLSKVIKPLCVACKSYTKTDYSQSCRLLQTIAKCDQLHALKRFQSYFPNTINTDSFMEQWVLCKKCSLLIDKIADMEEQLIAMKEDWLSRFRDKSDSISKSVDDYMYKREEMSSNTDDNSHKVHEGEFNLEKLIQEKFEIFEVIQPQKRKRHKNQELEKLAPVLISDDEQEQFSAIDLAKPVDRNEDVLSVISDENVKENNVKMPNTLTIVKKEMVPEVLMDKPLDFKGVLVKNEPLNHDVESVKPTSSSLTNGEEMYSNAAECLRDEFLLSIPKAKKDINLGTDSLPLQTVLEKDASGTSHTKPEGSSLVKTLKGDETSTSESVYPTTEIMSTFKSDSENTCDVKASKIQESSSKMHADQNNKAANEDSPDEHIENLEASSDVGNAASEASKSGTDSNETLQKVKFWLILF